MMPSFPNISTSKDQQDGRKLANGDCKNQQVLARRQLILQHRKSLPIASVERRLVEEVRKNDTLIIVGETGSGKTTQLPQFLYNAGFCHDEKIIGVTQPRRVAAVTVAKRVAEECNVELGQKVGYSIRFEDATSSSTRIKYMTDGLLLREALLDPLLSRYSIIIVDEAHERTVHTDVLLGLLKKVQLARCFSEYFGGAKAVHVHGRQYPVEVLYTYQPEPDYLDATLIAIFQIHLEEASGDILAFLTGQEEIESVERLVHERIRQLPDGSQNLLTVPIYASLPSEQQMNAFKPAPSGFRKVILATNIAETSVTIPGIKYVIDPGLVKARSYNPVTVVVLDGRDLENASGCTQRLKALGIDDIIGFDFMEKPSRMAIVKSLEQLFLLGALSDEYKLSIPVGQQMARLPLDPMYSKALILSAEFKCLEEMLIVVAMLSVESIFYFPREKMEEARAARKSFSSPEGDHVTLVNVYRASAECLEKSKTTNRKEKTLEKKLNKWCRENFINYRSLRHARDIHSQIEGHIQQMGFSPSSCGDDMLQFRRCLTASFFLNAATKQPDGSYRALSSSQTVQVHPSSVLFRTKADCIIFNELVRTNQNYVRNVTRVDPLWLPELAPQYYAADS
ncbi:hypothetical protein OPV22_006439 [Ensete ventricosum]|uniref:RNA helicase n=1 Tax=Ensete ventricosum TaxID=4639 RepID=A0AAV8RPN8_ENSVE|nr:hypothetical protein OPV22_006439 [Ensete ventricosum]